MTADRLLVCGSTLQLLDPSDFSIVELDGPPGKGCERVAVGPDGELTALAWEEGGFSEAAALASHDADGTLRWLVPRLELHETVFSRPALAHGPHGEVVVVGSYEPDFDAYMRVAKLDARGEVVWTNTDSGPTSREATAVTIAPNGQVVVAGHQSTPPSGTAIVVRVLDGGEEIYRTSKDLVHDEVDFVSGVVLAEDGRVVVAGRRLTGSYVAAFAPPSLTMKWDLALGEDGWGDAPAIALHPSGAIVAVQGDEEGANRNDCQLVERTLDSIPIRRPKPTTKRPQHMCLDKGYDFEFVLRILAEYNLIPHVRRRGEEAQARRHHRRKPRRWVVERPHSWFNRFRRILVRWEKRASAYVGMLHLVCGLIAWRATGLLG